MQHPILAARLYLDLRSPQYCSMPYPLIDCGCTFADSIEMLRTFVRACARADHNAWRHGQAAERAARQNAPKAASAALVLCCDSSNSWVMLISRDQIHALHLLEEIHAQTLHLGA